VTKKHLFDNGEVEGRRNSFPVREGRIATPLIGIKLRRDDIRGLDLTS
jgi:hypothetical protein